MLKKFVIERTIAGIGSFTDTEFCAVARAANITIDDMKDVIQWQHSYIADDKSFCVYIAESEETIRVHAEKAGFPVDKITEIHNVVDPLTGND